MRPSAAPVWHAYRTRHLGKHSQFTTSSACETAAQYEAPPAGFEPALPAPEGADQKIADLHNRPEESDLGRVMGARPRTQGVEVAHANRAFFGSHPRQASADDDAGKCRDGDPP